MDDLRDLVEATMAESDGCTQPFGLYVVHPGDPAVALAHAVERSVFLEFFGNSSELMAEEYGPYEDSSLFLCVLDHRRRVPAGVMRCILPSEAGLKSLRDIEGVWNAPLPEVMARTGCVIPESRTWDVATIAVTPDYRGDSTNGLISLSLYSALTIMCLGSGGDTLVTVIDLIVLDLIQSRITSPFQRFKGLEPKTYLDSPASLPVFLDYVEYEPRVRADDPTMHEILFTGRGLEPAVWTPEWTSHIRGAAAA